MGQLDHELCSEVLERLDDYLDLELEEVEKHRVEEHLEACAKCAIEMRFEATVLRQIRRKLMQLPVSEDFVQRVSERLKVAAAASSSPEGGGE